MRKILFAINITADGYCSHTDGIVDEELHEYFTGLLRDVDILLYGRKTYELMVPYWPDVARNQSSSKSENEFALLFDSLEKVVFSSSLKQLNDNRSRLARTDILEEVLRLKKQPGKDIAAGSLSIASQLSQHGLIDKYHFVVHPVVAGKGPRLFENLMLKDSISLSFVGSKAFKSGVMALEYEKQT